VIFADRFRSAREVRLSEHRRVARSVNESTISPNTIKANGRQIPKPTETIVASNM
ncbi:unnamed protein product, partial [Rotaria magnacalcarata]